MGEHSVEKGDRLVVRREGEPDRLIVVTDVTPDRNGGVVLTTEAYD